MEKKQKIAKIKQTDLIKNSPNKMNRSMDIVKTGCGIHKSKKLYNRKKRSCDLFFSKFVKNYLPFILKVV